VATLGRLLRPESLRRAPEEVICAVRLGRLVVYLTHLAGSSGSSMPILKSFELYFDLFYLTPLSHVFLSIDITVQPALGLNGPPPVTLISR
jgi:hypothetical protein